MSKFSNVTSLVILLYSDAGIDNISVSYIGMKGEITNMQRKIVNAVYELKPVPKTNDEVEEYPKDLRIIFFENLRILW